MGRSPMSSSSDESGVKKGPWTPEEDDKLINHIQNYGHGSWRALPKLAGLNRCGKSCRLRWTNYLRPDIKRGKFSQDEERTILHLHSILGNKWSAIASHLPGRTDNEIKNLWNTHLKKKLIQKGFDPMTHQPRTDIYSSFPTLIALANLIDNPASWEEQAMRLQAEALHMARLNHCFNTLLQPTSINISTPIQSHLPPAAFSLLKDALLLGHAPPPDMQFLSETAPFAHLPDLQAPCSDAVDQSCLSKGVTDFHQSFPATWMPPTLSPPPPPETSLTNTLDACSSSTYDGAAQIWSDLLDDPIFNDIV